MNAWMILRLMHEASSSSPSRKDGGAIVVLLKPPGGQCEICGVMSTILGMDAQYLVSRGWYGDVKIRPSD